MNYQHTLGNILSKHQFFDRLRIEKRRVDRSKASLSIILFDFHQEKKKGSEFIQNFLGSLHRNTRETDIKGWADRDVIGLILPDTDKNGAQSFIKKMTNGNGDPPYSVIMATYPDHIFQKILDKEKIQPDLFTLDIDESMKPKRLRWATKRGIDIVGSCIGLFLFSPLMLLAVIAIKVTSRGPVLFRQLRLGKKGIQFNFYKFRSMYINGDDQVHREYVTNLIKGNLEKINQGDAKNPLYKIKSDPRITRVGKIIRKTSIDELPQFFNVLKGEMSLVGPRPPIPYEVEKYEPWHLRRILEVKPGITGLWQVDGRSTTSFDDMVRLDLRYAQNWSLWLDVKILIKTVKAVLRPSGAL